VTRYTLSFTAGGGNMPACLRSVHDQSCDVPWGWDRDHTDQLEPYTWQQLAERQTGPHFYAYPDQDAYVEGWNLWRAYRRDERLNSAEADARFDVTWAHLTAARPDLADWRSIREA
jgi:hypothetical protein